MQSEGSFRRTWDKAEYTAKAKAKDDEERERMKENEELLKKGMSCGEARRVHRLTHSTGKRPRRFREELPKPTELLKQRENPLNLDKDLGKTIIVNNPGGRGPGQPGYYCEVCNRNCRDSAGYLDHINSRTRTWFTSPTHALSAGVSFVD